MCDAVLLLSFLPSSRLHSLLLIPQSSSLFLLSILFLVSLFFNFFLPSSMFYSSLSLSSSSPKGCRPTFLAFVSSRHRLSSFSSLLSALHLHIIKISILDRQRFLFLPEALQSSQPSLD